MTRQILLVWTLLLGSQGTAALAQDLEIPLGQFSANAFNPAPGPSNYLGVDGIQIGEHLAWSLGTWADYQSRSMVVDTFCERLSGIPCALNGTEATVVEHLFVVHVVPTLALAGRIQLAVDLPMATVDNNALEFREGTSLVRTSGGTTTGLGDIRFHVKGEIWSLLEDQLSFGFAGYFFAPTGRATLDERFVGEDGVSTGGHLIAEYLSPVLRAAVNVGGIYRPSETFIGNDTGPQLTYAGALGFRPIRPIELLAELAGQSSFGGSDEKLEARAGARGHLGPMEVSVASGAGIVRGPGTPYYRILFGVSYSPEPFVDSDLDGIGDHIDSCPSLAEDVDDFMDEDGCPDEDNDDDRFPDQLDECPNEAEDLDSFEDEDGCPEEDNDLDGIRDGYDSCPNTPEDLDGDRDHDGCPDNDRDRDGVPDDVDQCPSEAEDTDGLADLDGCPESDFDEDGILDIRDECPEEPEDIDQRDDQDGCPD
ncbi:MAG: thrombospondin type 3 repeat-containing protein [Myxococcota bacterium]